MNTIICCSPYYMGNIKNCLIEKGKSINNIDYFEDIESFVVSAADSHYDLLYLQINTRREMDMVQKIKELNPRGLIIIMASDDRYVKDAFRMNVFQYYITLSKEDIDYDFNRALNKYREQNNKKVFKVHGGKKMVNVDDIIYIESYYDNVTIYTTKGIYDTNKVNLKNIRENLKAFDFIRVISGYLVNMNYIVGISSNEVVLQTGQYIPISKTYHNEVLNKITQFTEAGNN